MPPKKDRLTRFDFMYKGKRTTVRFPLFDVVALHGDRPKVACVISKKRIQRAVDRNTVRRKMYRAWILVNTTNPYHVILYPQARVLTAPLSVLIDELKQALVSLP